MDEDTQEVIEQLFNWHKQRVDQLQQFIDYDPKVIKFGEDLVVDDPNVVKGVKMGIKLALDQLGKLPIKLQSSEDDGN